MAAEGLYPPTERLRQRIETDFPELGRSQEVTRLLSTIESAFDDPEFVERLQAAIVYAAKGEIDSIKAGMDLAAVDYRDVLADMRYRDGQIVYGPFANATYAEVLEAEAAADQRRPAT